MRNPTLGYFAIMALLGTFFAQTDLAHTVFSSYALLDGHVFDFYDFNAPRMVGNDYLLAVYIVFAVWMSPLFVAGLTTAPNAYQSLEANFAELLWAKLGLLTLLILLAILFQRIAFDYFSESTSERTKWFVLSSPFAILPVVVMGQYDVIGLLFVALGFKAWLGKRWVRFVIFFGLAISFKYLALAVFIPLLLMSAQSIRRAISLGLLAFLPIGLQLSVGLTNTAFRSSVATQPMKLLLPDLTSMTSVGVRILLALILCLIGIWLIRKDFGEGTSRANASLVAILSSVTLLFLFVRWNPQWLIYLVPFWALLFKDSRHPKAQATMEAVGFVGLVWMLAHIWANNVDDSMALRGAFADLLPERLLRLADFYPAPLLLVGVALVHLAIVSPITLRAWDFLKERRSAGSYATPKQKKQSPNLWLTRPLSFFIAFLLPVGLCFFIPNDIAKKSFNNLQLNGLERVALGQIHRSKVTLLPGELLSQSFLIDEMDLKAVVIDVSTRGKSVSGSLELEIESAEGNLAMTTSTLNNARDNSFPGFSGWLPVYFEIESLQLKSNTKIHMAIKNRSDSPLGIWVDDVRPEKVTLRLPSGTSPNGSIVMALLNSNAAKRGD